MKALKPMLLITWLVVGAIVPAVAEAQMDRPAIVAFCKSVKGKSFYLKIGVVSIQHLIGSTDATNVFPGPEVSYRGTLGGVRDIQASDAEDFAEEARLEAANMEEASVRHYKRGTQVTIEKSKVEKNEMEIHLKEVGGSKTKVRFKFGKHPDAYNVATVQEMFAFTFAATKEELAAKTVELMQGMSIAEVVQLKGNPLTSVNLGAKTILSYDDIKLIFQDGGLSDAE